MERLTFQRAKFSRPWYHFLSLALAFKRSLPQPSKNLHTRIFCSLVRARQKQTAQFLFSLSLKLHRDREEAGVVWARKKRLSFKAATAAASHGSCNIERAQLFLTSNGNSLIHSPLGSYLRKRNYPPKLAQIHLVAKCSNIASTPKFNTGILKVLQYLFWNCCQL